MIAPVTGTSVTPVPPGSLDAHTLATVQVFCDGLRATGALGHVSARGWQATAVLQGGSDKDRAYAAETIAASLGRPLYRVDLGQVVSKYIGETEKNLHRVFADAERSGAVLYLDEADALFGKRSEVKDSHDRYANNETNYMLQAIEQHAGVVIISTEAPAKPEPPFSLAASVIRVERS